MRDEESPAEEEVKEEQPEISPAAELISQAAQHYAEKGGITDEMKESFSQMSSQDLVDAYIEMQGNIPTKETPDLSDAEIAQIKQVAGGDEAYANITQWAGESLDQGYIDAFDSIVETGNARMVQLAVAGLKAEYERANGYEGEMLTGKATQQTADVFRSQAEVVAAMSDPRYDKDPAYRNDVFQKLDRSNIQF